MTLGKRLIAAAKQARARAQSMDDDESYPPEGGCLGIGATHTMSERGVRKLKKNPIGFVHFPDKPEVKARRVVKPKPKQKPRRRKR